MDAPTAETDISASPAEVWTALTERRGKTHLSLSQDNNASAEEAKHSKGNWEMMLAGLKEVVERG